MIFIPNPWEGHSTFIEHILPICDNHVTGHSKSKLTDQTQLQGDRKASTWTILDSNHTGQMTLGPKKPKV